MARIRSIHPGLRTDENFMALSFAARDCLAGLWMEADDHGVFAWKPLTLKARIFPVDNVDMAALLDELRTHLWLKSFDVDGVTYGICRNFRKWQRPKSPSYAHPFPPEWGNYIGLTTDITADVPHEFPMTSTKSPQREEGGGRREDEKKEDARPAVALPVDFEKFWEAYPHKIGKKDALKAWKHSKDRPELQDILQAIDRYTRSKPSDRAWCNPATWLNQGRWNDNPASTVVPMISADPEDSRWRLRVDGWTARKFWNRDLWGPTPDEPGCKAPTGLLQTQSERLLSAG